MPSSPSPRKQEPDTNGLPPTGARSEEDEFVEVELAITARAITLGHFRGLDGKPLTAKEAAERMDRSERYLRWRYRQDHE